MSAFEDTQKKIVTSLRRHFAVIVVMLVVLLLGAQFGVLATLGTKGTEVSRIRREKETYRVENEKLRAEIDSARTSGQIEDGLDKVFNQQTSTVRPVDVSEEQLESLDSVGLLPNDQSAQ